MTGVIDATGQHFPAGVRYERIVSLVPSSTETLFELGVGDRVVGVTRYCVHPADQLASMPRVGGTKAIRWDALEALQPDLILTNAEENTRPMIARLRARWPTWVAFPRTVDAAADDLRDTGRLVGAEAQADAMLATLNAARQALRQTATRAGRVLYLIWREPWMAAGCDTFISAMLAEGNLQNAISTPEPRYPTLDAAEIRALNPDVVLLSSEPYTFTDADADALAAATGLPRARILAVDGEACSWHGARMHHGMREIQRVSQAMAAGPR